MEFASKGIGGAGLGLGIAGTALGLMNGGLGNIGLGRTGGVSDISNAVNTAHCIGKDYVTREEMALYQQIAAKDSEIALIKSEQNTEVKIADVYARLKGDLLTLERGQNAINQEQAVYNGVNTATIGCIKNQVAELRSLAALKIPNTSVCPGWGDVTVTPAP